MTERDLVRMFEGFNARYFAGRVPHRRVVFRWDRPGADVAGEGYHDRKRRMILLCPGMRKSRKEVAFMLLHEMVHAAKGDYHGPKFWREWIRLRDADAPTNQAFAVHYQHMPTRELPWALRSGGMKAKPGKGGRRG